MICWHKNHHSLSNASKTANCWHSLLLLLIHASTFLLHASTAHASTPPGCTGNGGGMRISFANEQGASINQVTEGHGYRVVVELFTFPHFPPETEICRNFGGELSITQWLTGAVTPIAPPAIVPQYGDGLIMLGHGMSTKLVSSPIIADKHAAIQGDDGAQYIVVIAHHDWICCDGIVTLCNSFRSDTDFIRMNPVCPGDLDDSRRVDAGDIEYVLSHWGMTGMDDLLKVLGHWGACE